jgi:hypothetical protein
MRIHALILAVAAGTLLLAAAGAQDGGSQPSKQAAAGRVKELQQERIATLKAMVEVQTALHKIAKASPEDVLEARGLVCEAELDAAEKESDRIAILKNLVEVLKDLEETAKARKRSAEGTEAAVLKAKARRLEAEIRLERVRAQSQGQG